MRAAIAAWQSHGKGLLSLEIEKFISGYCRNIDESRMVCVVTEDGKLTEVDCSYACCPFTADCTVAQSIRELVGVL